MSRRLRRRGRPWQLVDFSRMTAMIKQVVVLLKAEIYGRERRDLLIGFAG